MRAWLSTLGPLVAFAIAAADAHAFPTSRLTYARGDGAEHCPDESALRRAVASRLGYDPFFPWAAKTIVARVTMEPAGWEGSVDLLDDAGIIRGSRHLRAPSDSSCSELLAGMALAISIAVDPDSVDRTAPPSTPAGTPDAEPSASNIAEAPVSPPPPDPAPAPSADSHALPSPALASSYVVELQAGIVGSAGLAPSWAMGPAVGLSVARSWWSAGFEARYQFVEPLAAPVGTVTSWSVGAALLACGVRGPVFFCPQFAADRLTVTGEGVTRPRNDATFLWRAGARAGVDIPLSDTLSILVYADVLARLNRAEVELDGRPVWNEPIAGLLGTALRGRFP
jgi:hypothetical protein